LSRHCSAEKVSLLTLQAPAAETISARTGTEGLSGRGRREAVKGRTREGEVVRGEEKKVGRNGGKETGSKRREIRRHPTGIDPTPLLQA
jgi:hypothetical protein